MRHRARRPGFTLVELLVVIAIISLLAAIILPVLSSARESARRIVCVSNLRQIGLALQMYEQDHTERLPGPGASGREWAAQIAPYVGNTQIFSCPSDTRSGVEPSIGGAGLAPLSFGWNSLYIDDSHFGFRNPDGSGVSLSSVSLPTETIAIFDYDNRNAPNEAQVSTVDQLDTGPATSTRVASRHMQGFNTLYADGHVKYRKFGSSKVNDWTVQGD